VPQVRPSQPPSLLPLLIFFQSMLFVNAYGSCCRERSERRAWPCDASGFDPHSRPVPTQGGSYLFSMIADIVTVRSSCAAAAHRWCHGHSCACWLLLLLLTRAPSDSCCACTCAAIFAPASQEQQGRLEKAILEYVILQGWSVSP
jgi:hypothetical protein